MTWLKTTYVWMGLLGCSVSLASGRSCVQCQNFKFISGSRNPFSGQSDPGCDTRSYGTTSCPLDEYCGTVWGTVTVTYPIIGPTTAEVTVRGCHADTGVGLGCHTNNDLEKIIGSALSFLTAFGSVSVKGQLCLSDTSSICPSYSVSLYPWLVKYPYCLHIGIVAAVGVAGVVIFLLIVTCCYCCCCRSQNRRGQVLQAPQSHVMTIQTGVPATSAPPYVRMQENQPDTKYP